MGKSPFGTAYSRSAAHTTHSSPALWISAKIPLARWLSQTPEEDTTLPAFTEITAFPARRPVQGENDPWHSKTGRITTQPPRGPKSLREEPSIRRRREGIASVISRVEFVMAGDAPTTALLALLQWQQQCDGVGGHQNTSSQSPNGNNSSGVLPGPSIDPRVLQRNPDRDNMPELPSTSNTPPSSAMLSQSLESTGPTQPPHNIENQPLAGPASPPSETGDVNVDDILRELLNFESEDEGNA